MLITSSLSNAKKYNAKYKYFIVINPKNVKSKDLIHFPELAPTRELYNWAMANKNTENWFEHYKEQFVHDMHTRIGMINALNDIEKKARQDDVLLICFCSDVNQCHRGLIADELASRGVKVLRN